MDFLERYYLKSIINEAVRIYSTDKGVTSIPDSISGYNELRNRAERFRAVRPRQDAEKITTQYADMHISRQPQFDDENNVVGQGPPGTGQFDIPLKKTPHPLKQRMGQRKIIVGGVKTRLADILPEVGIDTVEKIPNTLDDFINK